MKTSIVIINVACQTIRNLVYLVFDAKTRDGVVIDPGFQANEIESEIEHHKIRIRCILITHHHWDHTNLAEHMSVKYNIPVVISEEAFKQAHLSNFSSLVTVAHKKELHFGSIKITPILTPGHTAGCVCYLIDKSLFSGDTLFIEGCGVCNDQGSDPIKLFNSLRTLKESLNPTTKIYPGHKYHHDPGMYFSFVLKKNIYLHFNDVANFVAFRMRRVSDHFRTLN